MRVGIIIGGPTAEHEVSLQSGKSIFEAIDQSRHEVVLIGIDKTSNWFKLPLENYLHNADNPNTISLNLEEAQPIAFISRDSSHRILHLKDCQLEPALDVAFCIVHGTFGEDGGAQGFFNMLNLPFVGPDILGAAVGMDKDTAKMVLVHHGIEVADFVTFNKGFYSENLLQEAIDQLGLPLFIKPSSSGSSVGVKKANNLEELKHAVEFAFRFDDKVLVECFIDGREIECAVLGNYDAKASLPGEIVPLHDFYSYEAKYLDKEGAKLMIPADIPADILPRLQETAVRTYHALNCAGLARVDFFLTRDNRLIINEINTLPGFTSISMYPKLWDVSGIPYSELIDRLLDLAIKRQKRKLEIRRNIFNYDLK